VTGRDPEPAPYVFGHSEVELRRLALQAALIAPTTRRLLVEAGMTSGMRVLDVGTGRGDVAFLVAELVGETGSVVGVDRAPEAVAVARERAEQASLANVSFVEGDPTELSFAAPFDAVVGRYVLQFQPEPSTMLRRLASQLTRGPRSDAAARDRAARPCRARRPRGGLACAALDRRRVCERELRPRRLRDHRLVSDVAAARESRSGPVLAGRRHLDD